MQDGPTRTLHCTFNNKVQYTQNFTLALDNRQILLFEMSWLTAACQCRKMSLVLKMMITQFLDTCTRAHTHTLFTFI